MPTAVVNGDYAEVRYCCYTPSQISLNIVHYRLDILAGSWTDQVVADKIAATVGNAFKANMPNEARFRGVGVRLLVLPAPAEVFNIGEDGPGTAAGDLTASQVAGIITKRSARAGRRYRGRLFMGFVSSLDINADGSPANSYLTGLNGVATAIGPVMTLTDGANLMEASQRIRSPLVPDTPPFEPVASLLPRTRFGPHRSRGQYGAPNIPPW